MEKLLRLVLESTSKGQIEKQTAAQILHLLNREGGGRTDEIAVIGVGALLPNVGSLDELWANLASQVDFIGALPDSRRRDIDRYLDYTGQEDIDEISYIEGAYLEEIDKFDYKLFRLSPKEASLMDPYQRLFLQAAWTALEDGGYGGKKAAKSSTGVFVGYASNAKDCYQKMIFDVAPDDMAMAGVGNVTAMMPSRISYLLDLKGPTMVLDTACSSALVSVHTACQALKNGDCDMALAGSVRMNLLPYEKEYLKFGLESSDGRTRAFDDLSDGAGVGEAVLAVLLKPLKKAIKDRDHIYGVIKGSAINQDGTSIGITAPNPDAQMEVYLKAWQNADIHPETLAYIEAHGTGTTLGDPLELEGLERAYRRHSDKRQVTALGSAKTNIGHTFESAGLTGLLKCLLVLKHRTIPANLHFGRPNRKFNFHESPVYVANSMRRYEGDDPMRCGLSSFGFSGTNVHLVLEEAPAVERKGSVQAARHLFTLSARTEPALQMAVQRYVDFLQEQGDTLPLGDICYTASTGRGHYEHRLAVLAADVSELRELLQQTAESGLGHTPDDRVLYQMHKVVPPTKDQLQPNELTERDKIALSRTGNEQVQAFLDSAAQDERPLRELAALYARGAEIQWETLYQDAPVCKASLPVYAFEPHRCWIDVPEGRKETLAPQAADKYFTIGWKQKRLAAATPRTSRQPMLLFLDEKGLGQDLALRYRESGRRVITIAWGAEYAKVSDDHYILAGGEADYHRLLVDLQSVPFDKIIHLLSRTERTEVRTYEELTESQQRSVYSLFYLTRALAGAGVERPLDLVLIGENTTEVTGSEPRIQPEHVTLFGMGKVVLKEHSIWSTRAIDIDEQTTAEQIWGELEAVTDLYQVAYRNGIRYVEEFTEIDTWKAAERPLVVRANGVYLITGGTGGIGLEVARYLAAQQPVQLVMLNRTPVPEREHWADILDEGQDAANIKKIRNILDIEATGSTVTCFSVDVADRDRLRDVLHTVRQTLGKIDGVVHGAGVGGAAAIVERTMADFHAVFTPKVDGTWNLDDLTREDQLDFMVLFSSIASLFSAPGQGDYIAANGYLDSYASYRNKLGLRTTTINWSTWRETGMSVHHDFTVDTLFKAVLTREAIDGLDHVLNRDIPRALIGEVNYDSKIIFLLDRFQFGLSKRIQREMEKRTGKKKAVARKTISATDTVKLTGKADDAYSSLEVSIGTIWARVLGFAEINIYDNFFELGGDSILGLKMANVIQDELGIEISVADLLSYTTIADFVQYLEQSGVQLHSGGPSIYSLLAKTPDQAHYPASSAQKRVFVIDQIEGLSTNYNLSKTIRIDGPLDSARMENAFNGLLARHETLRTSFQLVDGEPVQVIHPQLHFALERYEAREADVADLLTAFVRPFDLSTAPLMRAGLIQLGEQQHVLTFDMHHIITDGVSIDVLIEEFVALYEGRELGELTLQYRDYAVWQAHIRAEGLLAKQEQFWLTQFQGEIPVLQLPTDFPRPAVKSNEGHTVSLTMTDELREQLQELVKSTNATLYMLLLAAYNVLLGKYAAQDDVVVGTPILGRPNTELARIVGMFVNTLVLRNRPEGQKTFREFVQDVRDNTLQAFDNQEYQLEEFVSSLRLQRDRSRNPLFDVMFVLQNVGVTEMKIQDLEITPWEQANTTAKFDLELEIYERPHEITLHLHYCTKLYTQATAERMLHDYVGLLATVAANAELRLTDIELHSSRQLTGVVDEEDELDEDVAFNF